MTEPLDLDALAALEAAARPGLWVDNGDGTVWVDNPDCFIAECWQPEQYGRADAAFIAASRNSLPALIERLRAAEAEVEALRAENERLHTWDGLLELLDEHWPADIFPTLPDNPKRDNGPRIVSLIRSLDSVTTAAADAEADRDAYRARFDAVRAVCAEYRNDDGSVEPEDGWRLLRDVLAALDGGA